MHRALGAELELSSATRTPSSEQQSESRTGNKWKIGLWTVPLAKGHTCGLVEVETSARVDEKSTEPQKLISLSNLSLF
jgi:hypothetical protein